jgi:hypothetical protein
LEANAKAVEYLPVNEYISRAWVEVVDGDVYDRFVRRKELAGLVDNDVYLFVPEGPEGMGPYNDGGAGGLKDGSWFVRLSCSTESMLVGNDERHVIDHELEHIREGVRRESLPKVVQRLLYPQSGYERRANRYADRMRNVE